ncbi:hypothetical protein SBDP1_1280012 [Syntrophobacter sp. SbD1]|nr:hypothetical protein SBDP1_1280012 [Syntrophobacter sp. SbD1]
MAIEQISYEQYMKRLDEIEKRYLSDEDFPEGAREKGLEICRKFRQEVEDLGPENCLYYIDTVYGLPMHKPIQKAEIG